MKYIITWAGGRMTEQEERENTREAFALAKRLIERGKHAVEITIPPAGSIIRGQAILDIYDAIQGLEE